MDSALQTDITEKRYIDGFEDDHLHDECAVFGVYDEHRDVGRLT